MHGYTCSAHPVGCAVALENLRIIEEEGLVERTARLGARLQEQLKPLENSPLVGEVRGLGLLAGIELVADKASKERFPERYAVGKKIREKLFSLGLYTRVLDEIICLAPPLVISEEEIDRIARIIRQAIDTTTFISKSGKS
jgi:adenosylmethionine-8-amino-7-oxononanoate aminotransferase